jgi:hypothetical protein
MIINSHSLYAQSLEELELNSAWMDKIRELAPEEPAVKPVKVPRILVFTLSTGYQHWVVPHTTSIMEILSAKIVRPVKEGIFSGMSWVKTKT